ncbi:MAG: calcium/sodium antiporter [Thermoanaerobaculales bacterium]|jgi:cation:H+ antiporter|nr:calcium/sodium antiporter [Thermoanaerobaculales bacterium]
MSMLLAGGLLTLAVGAELLVRGASRLAAAAGVSPLVIGLTVVAFGTSAPEMAASLGASLAGNAELALGNVVGSNVFNVFGILGVSALVAPLAVALRLVRIDVPIVVVVSLCVAGFAANGTISRWEGLLLVGFLLGHTVWLVCAARRESRSDGGGTPTAVGGASAARAVAAVALGLVGLVYGARWLVDGATAVASVLGVSDRVIGLSIVAIGTSLPELATSVVAAARGNRDIAVGNVVGSNLFNLTAVLGIAAIGSPGGVVVAGQALRIDLPVMVLAAMVCAPVFFTDFEVSRREGLALLATMAVYLGWVVTDALGQSIPTGALAIIGSVALAAIAAASLRQFRRMRSRE